MNNPKMMQIVGGVQRPGDDNAKTWWSKIGVAFLNRDGSWTQRFDYFPVNPANTTIQMRPMKAKEAEDTANEEAQTESA